VGIDNRHGTVRTEEKKKFMIEYCDFKSLQFATLGYYGDSLRFKVVLVDHIANGAPLLETTKDILVETERGLK
jgi:hypothetical protein